MFPINWNDAFRKKDGTLRTMEDLGSGGGGGSDLPPHTSSDAGKVLTVTPNNTLAWNKEDHIVQLCQPTVVNSDSTITLSDDYTNYDFILITCVVVSKGVNYHETSLYPTSILSQGERIGIQDDTSYTWLTITGLRALSYGSGEYGRVFTVFGVKS